MARDSNTRTFRVGSIRCRLIPTRPGTWRGVLTLPQNHPNVKRNNKRGHTNRDYFIGTYDDMVVAVLDATRIATSLHNEMFPGDWNKKLKTEELAK